MSFSVYEITVPVMVHGLNVMDKYLDDAKALERFKGFEAGAILGERLAPDMITLWRTVLRDLQQGRGTHCKINARGPAGTTRHRDVVSGVEQ